MTAGKFLIAVLVVGAVLNACVAAEENWDYTEQGKDWEGTCSEGKEQSPINIDVLANICDNSMYFSWKPSSTLIQTQISTAHKTYRSDGAWSKLRASSLETGQINSFTAAQFHFHAPSEHTIDGLHFPLEIHVVHTLDEGYAPVTTRNLAVVGIMFEPVPDDYEGSTFFDTYDVSVLNTNFNFNFQQAIFGTDDFDPMSHSFFAYEGSLTTPTCDERVNWYVLMQPLPIRESQMAEIDNFFQNDPDINSNEGNFRETQPLNDRQVTRYSVSGCVNRMLINTYVGTGRLAFAALAAIAAILVVFV